VCGEENISVGHMYTCVLISVKRKRVIYIYIYIYKRVKNFGS